MHDISIYDTGYNTGHYFNTRRNDGWFFASCFGGGVVAIIGTIMMIVAMCDPTAPLALIPIGFVMDLIAGLNVLMFFTHRNFGLGSTETQVMDALWTLPKDKRKKYNISRKQVKLLDTNESRDLVSAIREYRISTPERSSLIGLTRDLTDVNNEVRRIERRS